MRITLPVDTRVITFDEGDTKVEDLQPDARVAVVRDGKSVFARIAIVDDGEPLKEVIEVRLLSGQVIRLPRRTVVVLSNGGKKFVEALAVARNPTVQDWKNTKPHTVQRQYHHQTQTVEVKGKPLQGSDLLASWTLGVVEVPREVVAVEMAIPCRTLVLDIDDSDALAIVGDRPGSDPDGILVQEDF